MRITLVTVGKIKETYFTGAIKEYSKRLGRYWRSWKQQMKRHRMVPAQSWKNRSRQKRASASGS